MIIELTGGGPADGQLLDVPDGTMEWIVPIPAETSLAEPDPTRPESYGRLIYRRMDRTNRFHLVT